MIRRACVLAVVACILLALPAPVRAQVETNVEAWVGAIREADETIQAFEAAARRGDAVEMRRLAVQLRADPVAVQRLNQFGDDRLIREAARQHDMIQSGTRDRLRERLAREYNVPEDAIEFFEATNAPNPGDRPKLGQDWDVTVRVNGRDIPHAEVEGRVADAYFEATHGRPPASPDEARRFARDLSVEVTDVKHVEAYGIDRRDTATFFDGPPDARLRDPEQIRMAMRHKSLEPANRARAILDEAEDLVRAQGLAPNSTEARAILDQARRAAVGQELEQFRQFAKQYDKHILPRVTALGGQVPSNLDEAARILRMGGESRLAPAEVRRRLAQLGTSVDDVIERGTGLFEAAHKLRPPKSGLQTLAKAGGAVLAVIEIAGEGSRAALTVRERAAMQGEQVTWLGAGGVEMAEEMFNNMVVAPVKLGHAVLDGTIGEASRIMGEEFASADGALDGAAAFGRGMWRITKGAANATGQGLGWVATVTGNGILDLTEDPVEAGGHLIDATVRGLGEITGIKAIADNWYYDSEADRRGYALIRGVGGRYETTIRDRVNDLKRIENRLRETRSDTERRMLEQQYAEARAALGQAADRWRQFRDKSLGRDHPVGQELDQAMQPWLELADRAPTMVERVTVEGVDDACTKFLETTVNEVESLLGSMRPSELASLSRRLGTDEDHLSLMNCICRATSSGSSSVSKYYETKSVDYSPSCEDTSNGPCVNAGWGCWRHSPQITAEVITSCNVAYKVSRALCLRGTRR
ncbi:hypothetical protein [Rhodospira trueperi]|uniref:Uncharacterized protein n=1 Tax=Rhodospira trueperi TaxID=69960 RepID=A0A1G7GHV4_9PROT|nr:hypothetical protein [Rhodospira trueperi]SDE87681.1 hypothetical protein SAMN05421720_114106 [Rhodospira trueperi]